MTDRELLELAAKAASSQLLYIPASGAMIWLAKSGREQEVRRWNSRYAGRDAGCVDERGYVRVVISVDGKKRKIRGHTLAWFIVHGALPSGELDHINGARSDNKISNLREVSRSGNQRNKGLQQNSSTGYVGVTRSRGRDKWEAHGRDGSRRIYLGLYDSPEAAAVVAKAFRDERGYSARHGT
jgi:hypothetical protein